MLFWIQICEIVKCARNLEIDENWTSSHMNQTITFVYLNRIDSRSFVCLFRCRLSHIMTWMQNFEPKNSLSTKVVCCSATPTFKSIMFSHCGATGYALRLWLSRFHSEWLYLLIGAKSLQQRSRQTAKLCLVIIFHIVAVVSRHRQLASRTANDYR